MPKGILQILNAKAQSRKGKMLKSLRLSGFALKKNRLEKTAINNRARYIQPSRMAEIAWL